MRIGFILGILAVTGWVFFTAIQSLPVEASYSVAQTDFGNSGDQVNDTEIVAENAALRSNVAELKGEISELASTLDVTQARKEELETALATTQAAEDERLASLQSLNEDLSKRVTNLQNELSLAQQGSENLKASADTKSAEATQSHSKIEELESRIADLTRTAEASATTISELETALASKTVAEDLTSDVEDRAGAQLAEIESLRAEISEQTQLTTEMAELIGAMKAQLATLKADVVDRENKISELSARNDADTVSPATICQKRSDSLTDEQAVLFEPGTTSISSETVPLLQKMVGIAAACVQVGVVLDIEGHTDSSGGTASNLLLSNGRASAIRSFLAENGIPIGAMRAVGFGANDPIADNATPEGRSRNQRIVFDWVQK